MLIKNISVIFFTFIMILALTNCCTTKNDLKKSNMESITENSQRPPSPGNAEISCSVENLFNKGNKSFCKIKVSSVLNYGSGTRPIGDGSILELEYKDELRDELQALLSKKDAAKFLITEIPGGMGIENSSYYRILKIIK